MKEEDAFKLVYESYKKGRLPHAYVVSGSPRGSGLRLAERVSTLLLCKEASPPCLKCENCENALAHRHAGVPVRATPWRMPEVAAVRFSPRLLS